MCKGPEVGQAAETVVRGGGAGSETGEGIWAPNLQRCRVEVLATMGTPMCTSG